MVPVAVVHDHPVIDRSCSPADKVMGSWNRNACVEEVRPALVSIGLSPGASIPGRRVATVRRSVEQGESGRSLRPRLRRRRRRTRTTAPARRARVYVTTVGQEQASVVPVAGPAHDEAAVAAPRRERRPVQHRICGGGEHGRDVDGVGGVVDRDMGQHAALRMATVCRSGRIHRTPPATVTRPSAGDPRPAARRGATRRMAPSPPRSCRRRRT